MCDIVNNTAQAEGVCLLMSAVVWPCAPHVLARFAPHVVLYLVRDVLAFICGVLLQGCGCYVYDICLGDEVCANDCPKCLEGRSHSSALYALRGSGLSFSCSAGTSMNAPNMPSGAPPAGPKASPLRPVSSLGARLCFSETQGS